MKIQVTIKSQYGKERIFPVDDNAKRFEALIGRKTFSDIELQIIAGLGVEIEYVKDNVKGK